MVRIAKKKLVTWPGVGQVEILPRAHFPPNSEWPKQPRLIFNSQGGFRILTSQPSMAPMPGNVSGNCDHRQRGRGGGTERGMEGGEGGGEWGVTSQREKEIKIRQALYKQKFKATSDGSPHPVSTIPDLAANPIEVADHRSWSPIRFGHSNLSSSA